MTEDASLFRLGTDTSYLEIRIASENSGDVSLNVNISSAGFVASNGVWVDASDFTRFCQELKKLDATLKDEAILESMSPEEMNLRIFAANSRGGMALEVSLGRWIQSRDHEPFWHGAKVGFGFEPQQFAGVLTLPWIAKRL